MYGHCRKNNIGDHVVERTALPDHLIRNVSGKIVFQAEYTQVIVITLLHTLPTYHVQVAPLTSFSEQEINAASQRLVQQHANQFVGKRILRQVVCLNVCRRHFYCCFAAVVSQHHFVKMVPVSQVDYTYNDKQYTFWVYGDENRVYEEDYPLKCCCVICTIL